MISKAELLQALRDPDIVAQLHAFGDLDKSIKAHHHTLGKLKNQASPGPHKHDGSDSILIGGLSLMHDPVSTPNVTTSGGAELTIGSVTIDAIKGVRYACLWQVFDVDASVANDQYTFRFVANGTDQMDNSITIVFPSTVAGTTPVPTMFGTWVSTVTGPVTLEIRVQRVAGTGVLDVRQGTLYALSSIAAISSGGGGSSGSVVSVEKRFDVVQDIFGANSSTTSKAVTLGSTPSASNILLLGTGITGSNTVTSVTQTNVTWTRLATTGGGFSPTAEIWKGVPSGGTPGTTVTVNFNGSAAFNSIYVAEISGHVGTLDASAVSAGQEPFWKGFSPAITPTKDAVVFVVAAKNSGTPDYDESQVWASPSGIQVGALGYISQPPVGTVGIGLFVSNGEPTRGVFGGVTANTSAKSFAIVSIV